MAEEAARLTLAFVGDQEVHRNNARSLLEDFIDGWQKQHRRGEVQVLLPEWDNPTDTMNDLDDWASTAGHAVAHVGVDQIIPELLEQADVRLILVGDPNDDESLYDVAEEAAKYRIQTRSLINGLEKVVFDDEDFDDDLAGQDGFHEVDVESGDGWAADEKDELSEAAAKLLDAVDDVPEAPADDAPPDLDMLASLADDGEVEAQEEIKMIAATLNIDVTPFETWVDAVDAVRGKQITVIDADHPVFEEPEPVDPPETGADAPTPSSTSAEDVPPETGEDAETSSREEIDEAAIAHGALYTREELEAKSFDEVKAIALEHGIPPGRGMKHKVFVNKILQVTGVETDPPKRQRKAKLEAVPEPEASNVIPINEVVKGHSLKEIADSLRHYADVLDPPLEV